MTSRLLSNGFRGRSIRARGRVSPRPYERLVGGIQGLLSRARRGAARSINGILVATYWEIGRRIVHHEQGGAARADYGDALISRLSVDLTRRMGRGFSKRNLEQMRAFFLRWPIAQTPSAQSGATGWEAVASRLRLPWSHYVRLLSVKSDFARRFYEEESLRGEWSIRQLERQIDSQFYERTALSRNKAELLRKARKDKGSFTPEQELKDPFILEFLALKDEYSESDLEEALVRHLESFLLELGSDFAFVARQKRMRIGDVWYRVDLLFYHRGLRCLVLIDLKLGKFTHADAGQMHLYLNYAKDRWTRSDENPPVGLILCAQKDVAVAHYSLEGLPNKVLASEYRTLLPRESELVREVEKTRLALAAHPSRSPEKSK